MKKTLLTFSVFTAVICCTLSYAAKEHGASFLVGSPIAKAVSQEYGVSTPTVEGSSVGISIGTVDAHLYSESGMDLPYFSYAEYVAQTSEGTYMGFTVDSDKRASFVAINSTEESVTIPDSIKVCEEIIPVKFIGDNYHNLNAGFSSYNIKNLTVPASVIGFYWDFHFTNSSISAIYMLGSANIPLDYVYGSDKLPTFYVCNKDNYSYYVNSDLILHTSVLPYGWDFECITVNVEKKGEFAETYLTQNNYDWGAAQYVKVTGNINDIDLSAIKNLTSLRKLDLSETSITELPERFMYNRTSLTEVKLPATFTKIGDYAFYGCSGLQSFDLNGITEIGSYVFNGCTALSYINLNGVQTIGNQAFYNCKKLNNIDLSTVKYVGYGAFKDCSSIESIDLSAAIVIGQIDSDYYYGSAGQSFYNCTHLKSVVFGQNLEYIFNGSFRNTAVESIELPEGLTSIDGYVFGNCSNLTSVKIPASVTTIGAAAFSSCTKLANVSLTSGLTSIGDEAFNGCTSLEEITIPSTVKSIGSSAFDNTAIKTFKCYAVVPPTAFTSFIGSNMDMARTYLYVPPFSKDFYRNTQYWSNFYLMRSLDDQIDYILVDRPLTINLEEEDNAVVANNPEIVLTESKTYDRYDDLRGVTVGQLTATGEGTLSAGQLTISGQIANRSYYGSNASQYQYCPTLINYADKMRADNVTHNLSFYNYDSGEWHFISLPYDVKVSDIVPGDNTYWVIRKYDSAARAAGETSSTWVNLTNDDILEAGKGYIVSAYAGYDENGNTIYPSLSFTSGNSLTKNNLFRPTDVIVPLAEYAAEFAHNRSWNLIGNPYPCYFDMHYLNEEFTAPVTVWNGKSYAAYSPVDDDLVLSPYEAFFVQCPLNANEMTFKEAGRMHSNEGKPLYKAPSRSLESVAAEERNVFNFVLSGENYEDRARIVLNEDAKSEYEIGRDASKFFAESNENAQIYVNADVTYSICERPVNDGNATLGIRSGKENVYTLALNGKFSNEWHVILTDNETGITVDLTKESYQFTSENAENSTRFSVKFMLEGDDITGIDSIVADFGEDSIVSVTAINGVEIYRGRLSDIKVPVSGLYLISNGTDTRKAILK